MLLNKQTLTIRESLHYDLSSDSLQGWSPADELRRNSEEQPD